jgi:hypothetical protein
MLASQIEKFPGGKFNSRMLDRRKCLEECFSIQCSVQKRVVAFRRARLTIKCEM